MSTPFETFDFHPIRMFRVLNEHAVEYVVIGGVASIIHGALTYTNDADICPRRGRDHLTRLAAALRELNARIRTSTEPEGLPFACNAEFFERMAMVNMVTDAGQFDISFVPGGTDGYEDLVQRAVTFDIDGVHIPVASLRDVIHSKETANRAKDHAVLPLLYALEDQIAEREGREPPGREPDPSAG